VGPVWGCSTSSASLRTCARPLQPRPATVLLHPTAAAARTTPTRPTVCLRCVPRARSAVLCCSGWVCRRGVTAVEADERGVGTGTARAKPGEGTERQAAEGIGGRGAAGCMPPPLGRCSARRLRRCGMRVLTVAHRVAATALWHCAVVAPGPGQLGLAAAPRGI
jgi:hypothetical protein